MLPFQKTHPGLIISSFLRTPTQLPQSRLWTRSTTTGRSGTCTTRREAREEQGPYVASIAKGGKKAQELRTLREASMLTHPIQPFLPHPFPLLQVGGERASVYI